MRRARRIISVSPLLQSASQRRVQAFLEVVQTQQWETYPAACSNAPQCRRINRAHGWRENDDWRIAARIESHERRSATGESDSGASVLEGRESPGLTFPSLGQEQKTVFHTERRLSQASHMYFR